MREDLKEEGEDCVYGVVKGSSLLSFSEEPSIKY